MQYIINRLNRAVELDDELVQHYLEFGELTEHNFIMALRFKYGHLPTEVEITDEELSSICNEVLLTDLETFIQLPKIIELMMEHQEEFHRAAKEGTLLEFKLEE